MWGSEVTSEDSPQEAVRLLHSPEHLLGGSCLPLVLVSLGIAEDYERRKIYKQKLNFLPSPMVSPLLAFILCFKYRKGLKIQEWMWKKQLDQKWHLSMRWDLHHHLEGVFSFGRCQDRCRLSNKSPRGRISTMENKITICGNSHLWKSRCLGGF